MTAAERQDRIIAMLRTERMVTMKRLAIALGCSMSTVNRDIATLSANGFPIETVRGRYGGGVKLMDWYHPQLLSLCPEQMSLLRKIAPMLDVKELQVLNSIIDQFGPRR